MSAEDQQIFFDLFCLWAMETAWDVADSLDEERRHDSCSTCQDLPFRDKSWSQFYVPDYEDHGHIWFTKVSYGSLRLSSQGECPTCGFLFRLAELMTESRNIRRDMLELVSFRFGWQWWGGHGGVDGSNLHVEMNYESLSLDKHFRLYVTEGNKAPWSGIQVGRHLSLDRASAECVLVMKSWLSTCLESHPQCRITSSPTLPDRVLQISPSLDVQLIENFEQKIIGKYIALSHCWGGKVAMQLNSGNIEKFKQNILYIDLPKTFQDALRICKALDVNYIWIDSLCILQDSREDWAMQGSKMAQIYSDCLITIAADAAGNSRQGFLRRVPDPDEFSVLYRKHDKTRAPVHELEDSAEYEVHIRRHVEVSYLGSFPHHSVAVVETTKDEELGSHLSKRGWCFQEGLLPNRVLHFAFDHLSWTCATDSFCECMYGSIDTATKRYRSLLADGFEEGCIIDRAAMKEDWENIIVEYTRRRLSFCSDRLAALAGLAARVHAEHPNVEYLAGMWSDGLHKSLLWCPSRLYSPDKFVRVQPYIAPTWSWASITGSVRWAHQESYDTVDQSKLKLVAASCSPAGPNKYGALRSAELVVLGQLWRVKLLEIDIDHGFDSVQILEEDGSASPHFLPIQGKWDVPGEVRALHEQDSFSEDDNSSEASRCSEDDLDLDNGADDEGCSSEEEGSEEESSGDESSSDDNSLPEADGEFALLNVLGFVHFLVLSRCQNDERPNTFQRVGMTLSTQRSSSSCTSIMSPPVLAMGVTREVTLV